MKIIQLIFVLILLLLISSCSTNKAIKYFKEGEVKQQEFTVTFPFETKKGWIVIPVEIKNKTYKFVLDTGTPTLVSRELAETLHLKVIDSVEAADVYNASRKNTYTKLEPVSIAGIEFVEIVALINDFKATPIWASLEVDGFVGSNLMKHAIWDIDFKKKQITITDKESNLKLPKEVIENKLFIGVAGIPAIACKINGEKIWNFTVDLGYNGDIVIPFSEFEKQIEKGEITDFNKSNRKGAIGIYGREGTTKETYSGIVDEIEFGNTTLENKKVYSEQYLAKAFGLDFLNDYRVIINWDQKKIKLIEYK